MKTKNVSVRFILNADETFVLNNHYMFCMTVIEEAEMCPVFGHMSLSLLLRHFNA